MEIYPKNVMVHPEYICEGHHCPFHHPSDHSMKDWDINVRLDAFSYPLVERLCPHGVGHPDPDSVAWLEVYGPSGAQGTWSIHGCCGCCGSQVDRERWVIPPEVLK